CLPRHPPPPRWGGGVGGGGRERRHSIATTSRPPTPTLPHKGGGSRGGSATARPARSALPECEIPSVDPRRAIGLVPCWQRIWQGIFQSPVRFGAIRRRFPCVAKHVTMAASGAEKIMRTSRMTLFAAAIGGLALAVAMTVTGDPLMDEPAAQVRGKPPAAAATNVDVELAIAVDVSYSMDPDEQALQREGYITGLTSPEFLNALHQGAHGKIAITYFEWAGATDQRIVVPWRLIDSPAAAKAFTDEVAAAPYRRAYRTSISGALQFAMPLFEGSSFRGLRRVIDVSGDGVNNQGAPVTILRDEALERGIPINGLPILLKRPSAATMDIEDLDVYYEDCVIGGPECFVIPIREREKFKETTRTK